MNRIDMQNDAMRLPQARLTAAEAEHRFASRLRDALNEVASALPPATLERLTLARKAALRVQRMPDARRAPAFALQPAMAGAGYGSAGYADSGRFGFARVGLAFSALVLVGACLSGLYQFEQQKRIEELAEMDAAVLEDDLPISAYADHGFNAFLKQNP